MARVRNVVGIVAEVTDAEASRLSRYGWTRVDNAGDKPKEAAPRKRAAKKSDDDE